MQRLNLTGFEGGLSKLTLLPIWYLILAVVVGGTTEEILYRGYATERLSGFTGSYWSGSMLALIAFGLAHVPLWGWTPAFTTVISGSLLTLFYLWTGDLLPCIIAHIVTDGVGIIMPALQRRYSENR
ncbi:MAG: CPBP family intramembrane metalloprotease [Leptolyngbyaceae cyanobacterium SL_5_9]|nr:CPBP family intramembrane metalloprotease [Leptolyngbyaceae cyanobacterium SL_5_9]NJO72747.1 CPBP family intramembrane metalloprotease [Leptolyngbyaceae cyanobacterium RM1_406_9]